MQLSVIIPCYNCEKYIQETVNSVLKQKYTDFEIILIDDCSTDNTLSIIKEYQKKDARIRVFFNEKNIGVALTRNKGVEVANADYIAFLDSDDVWYEEKLEIQMQYMLTHENVDMTATSYELYDGEMINKINTYEIPENINYNMMLYENVIGLSTVIMKKKVFSVFKMSNEYMHEDYELWLKLLKNDYVIIGIREVLVKYRVFQDSRNSNKFKSLKERIKILYYEENMSLVNILRYTFVYSLKGIIKYKKI